MAKLTKRTFDSTEMENQAIRINKFLSDAGVCSRREADAFVEQGKVLIDGKPAVMGSKVTADQTVTFHGKVVAREEKMILIAMNKPQGIVCTTDRREPDNIIDFLNYGKRIYPIGRLDKDSQGLILLTNHGDIVNKILRAGNYHEKEYIVTVNKPLTAEFIKGMAKGVPILDTVTRPCTVEAINKTTFRIILTQGLNRQIRRMCEYFEYKVVKLERIRIMNVTLGHLQLGGYRNLTDRELETLREMIEDSQGVSVQTEEWEDELTTHVSVKNIHAKSTHSATEKKKQYKGRNFAKEAQEKEGTSKYPAKKRSDAKPRPFTKVRKDTGKKAGIAPAKAREEGKREYGNARQKTTNYRANRTSR